jgi:hypothetical protein
MSKTNIHQKVRELLFGKAAGRCEYRGCNELLTVDYLTKTEGKFSEFAHIVADSAEGPRGDPELSEKLKTDLGNIMLLCQKHHKLVDVDNLEGHPVELLLAMKQEHEARIERLTAIDSNHQTILLIMEANIGDRKGVIDLKQVKRAVLPMYPADVFTIDLAHLNLADGEEVTWAACVNEITGSLERLQWMLARTDTEHVSVFAMAPIPLLMWLGCCLGNIVNGTAYQRHRETGDWKWRDPIETPVRFSVIRPDKVTAESEVALVLSISNEITQDRLDLAPAATTQWYCIRATAQSVHVVRTQDDVGAFCAVARELVSEIARTYPQGTTIHLFPAAPNSLCVEFGRLLLPKADPCIVVYDWNGTMGGWVKAVTLIEQPT